MSGELEVTYINRNDVDDPTCQGGVVVLSLLCGSCVQDIATAVGLLRQATHKLERTLCVTPLSKCTGAGGSEFSVATAMM